MALTTTIGIPDTIVKGDAYSFKVNDVNFPVATWTAATIYFRQGVNEIISFSGVVSESYHLFSLTDAQTDTLTAGRNLAVISWSDGTNRGSSAWKEVSVLENPSATAATTHASRTLAAIESAIETFSTGGFSEVAIDGVQYTRHNVTELAQLRTRYAAIVRREQAAVDAARGIMPARIIASFTS
jgi:hypothetical protein